MQDGEGNRLFTSQEESNLSLWICKVKTGILWAPPNPEDLAWAYKEYSLILLVLPRQ